MVPARTMDGEIARWILEFLLRQPLPDGLMNKIITNAHFPVPNNDPFLKKSIILRSIESEIGNGSVSEAILDALEFFEELNKKDDIEIAETMKVAYCASAVECTVKYLGGISHKRFSDKFSEAVQRIWRCRIAKLENSKSELVTEELHKHRDEMETAVLDSGVREVLLERNTRNDALRLVRSFLREAFSERGPFLEQPKVVCDHSGEISSCCPESHQQFSVDAAPAANATSKKILADKHKHVAGLKRSKGPVRISNCDEPDTEMSPANHNALRSPEVFRVQEALKLSRMELRAVVKDPLPDAEQFMKTLLAKETEVQNNSVGVLDASNKSANASSSVLVKNILTNKSPDASNHGDLPATEHVKTQTNNGIPSCSCHCGVPKLNLMERNATAHTTEWKDSLEEQESAEGQMKSDEKKCTLGSSSKRMLASPLKKYKNIKFAKRRQIRRWSLEEEDALRAGVNVFGRGNWKLILNYKREVFQERTEVDLKDKWRNLTR